MRRHPRPDSVKKSSKSPPHSVQNNFFFGVVRILYYSDYSDVLVVGVAVVYGEGVGQLLLALEKKTSPHLTCCLMTPCEKLQLTLFIQNTCMWWSLRGRPLMIWGGPEENSKMNLFFPRDSLSKFFFPAEGLFTIFFPRRGLFFSRFPPASSQIINGRPLTCILNVLQMALRPEHSK